MEAPQKRVIFYMTAAAVLVAALPVAIDVVLSIWMLL